MMARARLIDMSTRGRSGFVEPLVAMQHPGKPSKLSEVVKARVSVFGLTERISSITHMRAYNG